MNKKERFMNFLQNKPVDRAPVAFFIISPETMNGSKVW